MRFGLGDDVIQVKQPPSAVANTGTMFVYQFPEDTFVHSNPEGKITTIVRQKTGDALRELPSWMNYDAGLLQVRGVVPSDAPETITLVATGRDQWGGEVSTEVQIQIRVLAN